MSPTNAGIIIPPMCRVVNILSILSGDRYEEGRKYLKTAGQDLPEIQPREEHSQIR